MELRHLRYLIAVAQHIASGRLVACTELSIGAESPWQAWQMLTVVHPEHRGHRLGLAIKLANLDALARHAPQVRVIVTGNAAVNAPMQGSAADIIKRAMIAMATWIGDRDDVHMLMQVHDELVFEVRADAVDTVRAAVIERMSGAAELAVPLLVDVGVGTNWDEAH